MSSEIARARPETVIDCSVHPTLARDDDLRAYLAPRWRGRPLPRSTRVEYPAFAPYVAGEGRGQPGSDPDQVLSTLRNASVDQAILTPWTRGLLPNLDLGTAVCHATNRWLFEVWLRGSPFFRGTLRVNPMDVEGAVREIEEWAASGAFAQVGVPTQAHHPYGHRVFWPVWRAAAQHGLAVAIVNDGGASVEFNPTAVGGVPDLREYEVLYPLTGLYHVVSLLAEGAFERIDGLRFTIVDGGWRFALPIIWRLDKDWKGLRVEVPWVTRPPSSYLQGRVRFCMTEADGPGESGPEIARGWFNRGGISDLLLYASGYPLASWRTPGATLSGVDEAVAHKILHNAVTWYQTASGATAEEE